MKYRTKIFLSLLIVSFALSFGGLISTYFILKSYVKNDFFARYTSLGNVVANVFHQMGVISDQMNKNAVSTLKEIDRFSPIPSNWTLDKHTQQRTNCTV